MKTKGLVMKVTNNYAIILTDDHEYLKIKRKEKCKVGQRILYLEEDVLVNEKKDGVFMSKKIIVAAVLMMAIVIGGFLGTSNNVINPSVGEVATVITQEASAIMTIDINPSVKLYLDDDGKVIEVKAINKDAKTLNFEDIVGMDSEVAVEAIVKLANDAGFINEDDLIEDYVLVTTVSMDEDEEEASKEVANLQARIQEKIAESDELQDVNVAFMKATKVEMREAEGKNIPIGLYVANGKIAVDGEEMSVKEYFANQENREKFQEKGEVVERKEEKKIEGLERVINRLEEAGEDVSELRATLQSADLDIDGLQIQVKAQRAVSNGKSEENGQKSEQANDKSKGKSDDVTKGDDDDDEEIEEVDVDDDSDDDTDDENGGKPEKVNENSKGKGSNK